MFDFVCGICVGENRLGSEMQMFGWRKSLGGKRGSLKIAVSDFGFEAFSQI